MIQIAGNDVPSSSSSDVSMSFLLSSNVGQTAPRDDLESLYSKVFPSSSHNF